MKQVIGVLMLVFAVFAGGCMSDRGPSGNLEDPGVGTRAVVASADVGGNFFSNLFEGVKYILTGRGKFQEKYTDTSGTAYQAKVDDIQINYRQLHYGDQPIQREAWQPAGPVQYVNRAPVVPAKPIPSTAAPVIDSSSLTVENNLQTYNLLTRVLVNDQELPPSELIKIQTRSGTVWSVPIGTAVVVKVTAIDSNGRMIGEGKTKPILAKDQWISVSVKNFSPNGLGEIEFDAQQFKKVNK
jgi:hypothetical protein